MCWVFFFKDLFTSIKTLKPFLLKFISILQIWVYPNSLQHSHRSGGGQRLLLCVPPCGFSWDRNEVEGPGVVSSWSSKDPQQCQIENRKMNLQVFNLTNVYSCSSCIVFLPRHQRNKSYSKIKVAGNFVEQTVPWKKRCIWLNEQMNKTKRKKKYMKVWGKPGWWLGIKKKTKNMKLK